MEEDDNKTNKIDAMEYAVFYFGMGMGMFGIIATILNILGFI